MSSTTNGGIDVLDLKQEDMESKADLEEDARNKITDKELSECDRENLSHVGLIQGGCGHVLFMRNPSGEIVGHDDDIFELEFIKHNDKSAGKDHGADAPMKKNASLIGNNLEDFICPHLHTTIFNCVEQMKVAMSQRTFHFYAAEGKTFALSISSTDPDYSIVGIEIESSADSQEVGIRYSSGTLFSNWSFDLQFRLRTSVCRQLLLYVGSPGADHGILRERHACKHRMRCSVPCNEALRQRDGL